MLYPPRTAPVCRGGRNDIRDRDSAIARTGPADRPLAINATRARLTVSESEHEPASSGEVGVDRPPPPRFPDRDARRSRGCAVARGALGALLRGCASQLSKPATAPRKNATVL